MSISISQAQNWIDLTREQVDVATKKSQPARTLLVFVLIIGAAFAGAISLGNWKPKLGLDLQGGTLLTLQAKRQGGSPSTADMNQAIDIIRNRVNGIGVSESQVTKLGSDVIQVAIPGRENKELERTVARSAQLRFRVVALGPIGKPKSSGTTTGTSGTSGTSGTKGTSGTTSTSGTPSTKGTSGTKAPTTTTSPTTKNRSVVGSWMDGRDTTSGTTTTPGATAGTTKPKYPVSPDGAPAALAPPQLANITDPINWTPDQTWQAKLYTATCPTNGGPVAGQIDVPSQPLVACDKNGSRFLLGPAIIEGRDLTGAKANLPTNGASWEVDLGFDNKATKEFTNLTEKLAGTSKTFAVVLDGSVASYATVEETIATGNARITGSFSQQEATDLANVLKYGALPLSFELQGVHDVGPQLASNQLNAGILAGIIGLLLVVGYCMLYYRALFVVIVASLGIAGVLTYVCVLLLGHAYGFTLTLPGIAGLIVAVGITADSFIVYFERIRDEVRDGRSLRTAVESGWRRARMTIIAADSVSFLAALVLFIFAIDVIKGFAFALGLTTLIDVFVVFFFTKPLITIMARTQFFGRGHPLSGFDRRHLGVASARPRPAGRSGGKA
jgi:preprotein translocase subunit SecD